MLTHVYISRLQNRLSVERVKEGQILMQFLWESQILIHYTWWRAKFYMYVHVYIWGIMITVVRLCFRSGQCTEKVKRYRYMLSS